MYGRDRSPTQASNGQPFRGRGDVNDSAVPTLRFERSALQLPQIGSRNEKMLTYDHRWGSCPLVGSRIDSMALQNHRLKRPRRRKLGATEVI